MIKKIKSLIVPIVLSLSVIIFILMPFVYVFKEAFFLESGFSLDNFIKVLWMKKLIGNSLKLSLGTSLLSVLSSVFVSLYLYLSNKKIRTIITTILSITLISPPFVTSLSYINLFGRRGFISHDLLGLSINPYNMRGIMTMQTVSFLSLNTLLLVGFLEKIDQRIIDSARSLGAGTNNIIKDILLPSMKNGISTVFMLSFFKSIADFATPNIIGGKFSVLALEAYFEVIANGNLSIAASMNIIILFLTLVVYFIFARNRGNNTRLGLSNEGRELKLYKKTILYYIIAFVSIFLILVLSILYISIIFTAFTKMKRGSLVFTLDNFKDTGRYINSISLRSIGYSLISALGGSLLGMLIGYFLIIKRVKYMKVIDYFANLPYIIPGMFFGLGYLLFFRGRPFYLTGTSAIVILNVTFKQLPFSTRLFNASMKSIDRNILRAIRDLGATSFYEVKDGIIPLSRESMRVSLINAFTTTMTTVGSIIFLVYPSKKLMTLVMFDVINSGKYNEGSVIALYILLICLVFNLLFQILTKGPRLRRKDVSRNKKLK
ncbi:thiamine transporter membrane protein [Anaerococcus prevotii]|uniref:Binding-protein-dependent transport systems inner membrane component n=1 Tax=Anaerococcus prevotii (strain ATCC 9321 / DSM 20548 / JCM 6508 / NCTC 11806 / PC1) TaxID=525919 RepID=C7RF46_ANAPD|nr:iron ABC transporter permease [Anaerococcus prevotii]ACV28107.1 binding-protein-dependent transport systems inner membrane component [Anaerococcus prevotii DSM 20548]SUU93656.1 thiamine transporter membrane protein [Anaerococcus prevotii]